MQANEIQQYKEMEWFGSRVRDSRYVLSEHALRFLVAGKVTMLDIEAVLLNGSVMEERQNSVRGTSYLVYGESDGKPVHVVCAADKTGGLVVIFAYVPTLPIWESLTRRNNLGGDNMTESAGACYFCGGDMKAITMGNFDYRREGALYIIKKIPATLCLQCGEKYIGEAAGKRINELIDAKKYERSEQAAIIDFQ